MDPYRTFGFLLKDVCRLYTRRFEERAHELALTLTQCKALIFLERNEGCSQKRLAELLEIDPMSLVRILDRMEADGWVQRQSDPDDRRARCLKVTEKGKPIVDRVWSLSAETRAEVFAVLSTAERTLLVDLLERVHQNLLSLEPLAHGPGAAAPATEAEAAEAEAAEALAPVGTGLPARKSGGV